MGKQFLRRNGLIKAYLEVYDDDDDDVNLGLSIATVSRRGDAVHGERRGQARCAHQAPSGKGTVTLVSTALPHLRIPPIYFDAILV
jgi:hypothetical protein